MNDWLKTVQIPCNPDTGCQNAEEMPNLALEKHCTRLYLKLTPSSNGTSPRRIWMLLSPHVFPCDPTLTRVTLLTHGKCSLKKGTRHGLRPCWIIP